jgi:hypothetical protein
VSLARASRVRDFIRLVLVRVEHIPALGTPQWKSLRSIIAVEGAVTSYFAATLLIAFRFFLGPVGFLDSSWGIWCVIALAMTAAWALCRGIENEERTQDARSKIASVSGIDRFKESGLGVAFLVGGLLALGGASYFATR